MSTHAFHARGRASASDALNRLDKFTRQARVHTPWRHYQKCKSYNVCVCVCVWCSNVHIIQSAFRSRTQNAPNKLGEGIEEKKLSETNNSTRNMINCTGPLCLCLCMCMDICMWCYVYAVYSFVFNVLQLVVSGEPKPFAQLHSARSAVPRHMQRCHGTDGYIFEFIANSPRCMQMRVRRRVQVQMRVTRTCTARTSIYYAQLYALCEWRTFIQFEHTHEQLLRIRVAYIIRRCLAIKYVSAHTRTRACVLCARARISLEAPHRPPICDPWVCFVRTHACMNE